MNTSKVKSTVESLEVMIQNADKGPSGFGWKIMRDVEIH